MPELPEIETLLQGLLPELIGEKIAAVLVRNPSLRWPVPSGLADFLPEQSILQLKRRGKYLLISCSKGTLLIHLGMSGSLKLLTREQPLKTHDHVDIRFYSGKLLRYHDPRRFGAILWTPEDPLQHPLIKSMAVEPLEAGFSADYLKQKAVKRKVAIKTLIMNAHIVTGVGNIYAQEALFMAGLHPLKPADTLTLEQCHLLVQSIQTVLKKAILQGGTTLKDFVNAEGKPGYFSQQLQVYGRAGKACQTCQTPLEGIKQNQRSTVFCPTCQQA